MNNKLINLRLLNKDDLPKLVRFRNDHLIWKFTKGQGNFNKKRITIKDEIAWFKKVSNDRKRLNLAITLDDKYIGNVYFTNITKISAEFEIFIGEKSLWAKGYGFISTKIAISFFTLNYKIKEIYLTVRKDNIAARKLYAKCGFKLDKKYIKQDIYLMRYKIKR